jgi:putative ABC transport system permease protein
MIGFVGRSIWRHQLAHPLQLALTVTGVTLGVAVVVAMDLAIESSRASFRLSAATVAGAATHQVVAGSQGLPDEVFARVRVDAGVRASAPVVEGWAEVPSLPGELVRVLGVDPFSELPFRPYLAAGAGGLDASPLLVRDGGVVLSTETATRAGVAENEDLDVRIAGARHTLHVVGVVRPEDDLSRRAIESLLVVDVAEAQRLLGMEGRVSRIDLRVPEGATGDSLIAAVRGVIPSNATVVEAGTRARSFSQMIRAFDLNLTALSFLALIFGMFLVYNTMTFSVVQRRGLIGILRALGVTRREIVGRFLLEAAALGLAGSALGLASGALLGRTLVRFVTQTINDLWAVVSLDALALSPVLMIKGAAMGLGATLAAAAWPALETSRIEPRVAMVRSFEEDRARGSVPRLAVAGTALLLASAALILPSRSVPVSFVALFLGLMGVALLTPVGTVWGVSLATPVLSRLAGVLGRMAGRGVTAALSRTAPAISALVVAVSVTVGLGAMISSFRSTLTRWLDGTLRADVYASLPGPSDTRPTGSLDDATLGRLRSVPGVVGISTYRAQSIETEAFGSTRVVALDLHPRGEGAFDFKEGDPSTAFRAFRAGTGVFLSEPFAYRTGLAVGDEISLPTEFGPWSWTVEGVFFDYGSDRGSVLMSRDAYDARWRDRGVTSVAFFAAAGLSPDSLVQRLRAAAGPESPMLIQSSRGLRDASLEVFDRTFAVTSILRLLAFIVAFIGVLSALMALQLERRREFGVMRALGLTPRELGGLVTMQTGVMGLLAGVMAVPAGLLLAIVMIYVVNRRSFGWTLRLDLGPDIVLQAVGLAIAGALLAGLYPGLRMARTPPSEAIRSE